MMLPQPFRDLLEALLAASVERGTYAAGVKAAAWQARERELQRVLQRLLGK